jgi:VIT1/CCC1 family predicted Fe2+/Mn2+ transporter
MSLMKRVDQARQAYAAGDLEASARAHAGQRIALAAEEEHGRQSDQYIGNMVYGGLDGIVTTFAVVSGVAGAQLGVHVILIMGLANLFADGFSMATGAYLSSRSEQEYYEREKEREAWEVDHFPEGEKAELIQVYHNRGYAAEEARSLVEIQMKDRDRWVNAMMVDELGMMADERKPLLSAVATFISFLVAGSVPLLVYLLGLFSPVASSVAFPVSLGLSALALFGLGAAKVLITERNFLKSGLEMLLVGGLAAVVAYVVGALLKGIGG